MSSVHRVYKHPSLRSPLWFPLTVTGAPGKNEEVLEHTFPGFLLPGELVHWGTKLLLLSQDSSLPVIQSQSTLFKNAQHQFYFKIAHEEARQLHVSHLDPCVVCIFFIFWVIKWEVHIKHSATLSVPLPQGKHLYDYLNCEPNWSQCSWNTAFTWKHNWQAQHSDLGTWQTLSLQWSEKVTSGKTTDSIRCQGQPSSFQLKCEMPENSFPQWAGQLPNTSRFFLTRSVVILTIAIPWNFITKNVNIWNICIIPTNQYFPNDQYLMQWNDVWAKIHSKCEKHRWILM